MAELGVVDRWDLKVALMATHRHFCYFYADNFPFLNRELAISGRGR